MQDYSPFPSYRIQQDDKLFGFIILVITEEEIEEIPSSKRGQFGKNRKVIIYDGNSEKLYCNPKQASKIKIQKESLVSFSQKTQQLSNFYGIASDLLSSAYVFTRKSIKDKPITVHLSKSIKDIQKIINLAQAKNRTREWANGRGDQEGVPAYFEQQAKRLSQLLGVKLTVIKGDDLLKEGFRLMHAVGRASKNVPTFINLSYEGDPQSSQWISFVGKGVCFDAGGLDIKRASGMKDMFLDKHGACSVLSAFQAIVQQKLKVNLTISMGFVQNFISSNSYRPSDIIKSRKGLTVQVSDTDAEGRLVLADCMNWTQQKYKVKIMIQLSTLTYIAVVFGSRYAGIFSNSDELVHQVSEAGKQVNEMVWRLPLEQYYHDLLKSQVADLASDPQVHQSQAAKGAAFLEVNNKLKQRFVQKDTKWIHMDIGDTAIVNSSGTGYGARLLVQFIRKYANSSLKQKIN